VRVSHSDRRRSAASHPGELAAPEGATGSPTPWLALRPLCYDPVTAADSRSPTQEAVW